MIQSFQKKFHKSANFVQSDREYSYRAAQSIPTEAICFVQNNISRRKQFVPSKTIWFVQNNKSCLVWNVVCNRSMGGVFSGLATFTHRSVKLCVFLKYTDKGEKDGIIWNGRLVYRIRTNAKSQSSWHLCVIPLPKHYNVRSDSGCSVRLYCINSSTYHSTVESLIMFIHTQ